MNQTEITKLGFDLALVLACPRERSEGTHTDSATHTRVPGMMGYLLGGLSPSARLGITEI